ncbi:pyruvate kinase [Desulfurobacterium sp.]
MKRAKIVATLGPSVDSFDVLKSLVLEGLNVVRLNMSHGTHEEHRRRIKLVRKVENALRRPIPVLVDLCGPKIRIGKIKKEPLYLHRGNIVVLTADRRHDDEEIFVNYERLPEEVKPGEAILLADGAFRLKVIEVKGKKVVCEVVVGGPLTSHKGVNLPHTSLSIPALTSKDKEDVKFAVDEGADILALSFVRRAEDVTELKDLLEDLNASHIPVVAKIEKPEAVERIDEILDVADGVMVARGDLGVEMPIEKVPVIQKMLIRKANRKGKPVITATQMLKSMVDMPIPTRAEVTDIANAVLDGTDALMLSEETAVGKYPVEVIRTMSKVIVEAEKMYPYRRYEEIEPVTLQDSLAKAACGLARNEQIKAIIPFTRTGATAMAVAKFRPSVPVFAVTHDVKTSRKLSLVWGIESCLTVQVNSVERMINVSVQAVKDRGIAKPGDRVIVLAGAPTGVPGSTNLVKVVEVK